MSSNHKTEAQKAADRKASELLLPTKRKRPTKAVQIVIEPASKIVYPDWRKKR